MNYVLEYTYVVVIYCRVVMILSPQGTGNYAGKSGMVEFITNLVKAFAKLEIVKF